MKVYLAKWCRRSTIDNSVVEWYTIYYNGIALLDINPELWEQMTTTAEDTWTYKYFLLPELKKQYRKFTKTYPIGLYPRNL